MYLLPLGTHVPNTHTIHMYIILLPHTSAQMWGLPYEHRLYRLNNLVNLATFIVFRFGALWVIGYGLLHWRHLVSSVYYAMMFGSWAIMSVINVVLFWRLVKNDIIRPMSVKCKSLS